MILRAVAMAAVLALLQGCISIGAVKLAASLVSLGASGYTLATRVSTDVDSGLVSACAAWSARDAIAQQAAWSGAVAKPAAARLQSLSGQGSAVCRAIASGHPPPSGPAGTIIWLATIGEMEREAASAGISRPRSI